jgi:chromosome segregation ATPase
VAHAGQPHPAPAAGGPVASEAELRSRREAVAAAEAALRRARERLAEISRRQSEGDAELALLRAELQAVYKQVSAGMEANAELAALRAEQARLVSRKRDLHFQLRELTGGTDPTASVATGGRP